MTPPGESHEFATAGRIVFGRGARARLPQFVAEFGARALLVTGKSARHAPELVATLGAAGIASEVLRVEHEPSLDDARRGVATAKAFDASVVVALGGGSALDAGKAIAALIPNAGDPLDYVEVVGAGRSLTEASLPCIAVPTTAGTGAEVTKNAVLGAAEQGVKVSLRSLWLLPRVALLDPELTLSVPPAITASTGFDALAQVMEPYVSHKASPLTDPYCLEGMRRSARSLRAAVRDGSDVAAREDLCLTSLFGGMALANAKLGAVHGFASPLGAMFGAPHGALCAALLPQVMRANLRALHARAPQHPALERYTIVAQTLTQRPQAKAEDGLAWVEALLEELGVPRLRAYGVGERDFDTVARKAAKASSMQGNPIALGHDELVAILAAAS